MAENEVVHVAVAPPATLDEELVKKVAAVVGKSPYETRLRLTGKIPKIIANYDILQQAELTTKSLKELGLVVILFTDSELRKPWQIFKARNLKFEEQAITFCDRSGQARRMEAREAFLILSARMQAYTDTEVIKTTRKLNVTATLLTGGIPIMKKVEKKTTTRSFQTESFVRLYGRTSPEPAVQIPQHDFDYSFLGTEMVSSAAANFGIAIRKIREAFPQAIFDDSLIEPFGANMPATMVQDSIESNCKLIYWYHQAVRNAGTSVQTQLG
jgi:hypothetical protein